jgi:hypothetical protein
MELTIILAVKNGVKKLVFDLLAGLFSIISSSLFSKASIIAGIESVTRFNHRSCNVVNISILSNIDTNTKITSTILPANKYKMTSNSSSFFYSIYNGRKTIIY